MPTNTTGNKVPSVMFKTTVVLWTDYDPLERAIDMRVTVHGRARGALPPRVSRMISVPVHDPCADPDWQVLPSCTIGKKIFVGTGNDNGEALVGLEREKSR